MTHASRRRAAPLAPLPSPLSPLLLWLLLCLCAPGAAAAAGNAPQEASARMGDARIHYLHQGQGPDAVVFVHGWSCDASFWDAQMAALGKTRRVIALDLLGCGRSSAPDAQYTQDLLAQSLAAVMDAAKVRRAVLVGHSMGLSVAKRYIDAHPDRVAGLFIVDGAYIKLPDDKPQVDQLAAMLNGLENAPDAQWRAFVGQFVQPMLAPQTPPAARRKILSTMQGSPRQPAHNSFRHFLEPDAWSGTPAALPVRAVYAASLAKGLGVRQYLATVFPNLDYTEWTRCGHFIMFDQSQRLTKDIEAFAARVLR